MALMRTLHRTRSGMVASLEMSMSARLREKNLSLNDTAVCSRVQARVKSSLDMAVSRAKELILLPS